MGIAFPTEVLLEMGGIKPLESVTVLDKTYKVSISFIPGNKKCKAIYDKFIKDKDKVVLEYSRYLKEECLNHGDSMDKLYISEITIDTDCVYLVPIYKKLSIKNRTTTNMNKYKVLKYPSMEYITVTEYHNESKTFQTYMMMGGAVIMQQNQMMMSSSRPTHIIYV